MTDILAFAGPIVLTAIMVIPVVIFTKVVTNKKQLTTLHWILLTIFTNVFALILYLVISNRDDNSRML